MTTEMEQGSCLPQELRDAASRQDVSAADQTNSSTEAPRSAAPETSEERSPEAPAAHDTLAPHATSSVFSRNTDAPVHDVPMRVIHRPLPSELDEDKVRSFMDEMEAGDVFTPIEVIKVVAPLKADPTRKAQTFYFAMGGCHRYEATKRLRRETIRARIITVPPSAMRVYLGAGCPF